MKLRALILATSVATLAAATATAHPQINKPNGGVTLPCGSVYTIEWTINIAHNTLNWDLWYSTSGTGGPWIVIAMDLPPGDITVGSIHTYDWVVPDDVSSDVYVRVLQDNSGADYIDRSNNANTISKLSVDLGYGKVGGNGLTPVLSACGDLAAGGLGGTISLQDGPADATTFAIAGTQLNPTPFKGGTLAPLPPLLIAGLSTDSNGAISGPIAAGQGPLTIYVQFIFDDPGATQGVGLSNAIQIDMP